MTGDARRLLILVRHAKSAWPDVLDRERPLAKRGRRQAPLAGAWLRSGGYRPDLVLCSPALRTRETWELIEAELGKPAELTLEERVYGASAGALLELIREVTDTVTTLLLVGHSPGLPDLAMGLAGGISGGISGGLAAGGGDASGAGALERLSAKFPTAGVAVLGIASAWHELSYGSAALRHFVIPRDLESEEG